MARISNTEHNVYAFTRVFAGGGRVARWLDPSASTGGDGKVHVFDPGTGENLTRDAEAGAELTRLATQDRVEQVEEARGGATSVGAA